jgi:hypothetical protein
MTTHPVVEPIEATPLEMRIEGRKVGDIRHRHQEVAPGVADQALHPSLTWRNARQERCITS